MLTLKEIDRFYSKFTPGDPGECWEWKGEIGNRRYGIFSTHKNNKREKHLAHRLSLELTGTDLRGLNSLHRCDNPPCVNPNHLYGGTQADNARDAMARNRLDLSGLVVGHVHSHRTERLYGNDVAVDQARTRLGMIPRPTGCLKCGFRLVFSNSAPLPEGTKRHRGRQLCTLCYQTVRRAELRAERKGAA